MCVCGGGGAWRGGGGGQRGCRVGKGGRGRGAEGGGLVGGWVDGWPAPQEPEGECEGGVRRWEGVCGKGAGGVLTRGFIWRPGCKTAGVGGTEALRQQE
jgi:hypothetical protein